MLEPAGLIKRKVTAKILQKHYEKLLIDWTASRLVFWPWSRICLLLCFFLGCKHSFSGYSWPMPARKKNDKMKYGLCNLGTGLTVLGNFSIFHEYLFSSWWVNLHKRLEPTITHDKLKKNPDYYIHEYSWSNFCKFDCLIANNQNFQFNWWSML